MIIQNNRAPLTPLERVELRRNARDVVRTAIWKGFACDPQHARIAQEIAHDHFDLGCWLYYYSRLPDLMNDFEARVDCAEKIFETGFSDPSDNFLIVFGFGKTQFTSLFKDGSRVLDELARRSRRTG